MTSTAHTLTEGLIALSQSLTDLGHTHAKEGRPPIHHDFLNALLSYLFMENKSFQDDPEWGNQMTATITDFLMDNYMTVYNSIQ